MPLTRRASDKVILIHTPSYEDWRPRSPDGSSSWTSLEYDNVVPTYVPFNWVPGVLNEQAVLGQQAPLLDVVPH